MSAALEYRTLRAQDLSLGDPDATAMHISGYAARFNESSLPVLVRGEVMLEEIDPRAFDATLNDPDVSLYWQHDPSEPLASTLSGTLNLRTTDEGLLFDADLPQTTLARDAMALLRRGLVRQMSFGFRVVRESMNGRTRRLDEIELQEISLVERAAYPTAGASARSRTLSRDELALRTRLITQGIRL